MKNRAVGQLGDLQSIMDDLERAIDLCDRLDAPDLDDLVASALWEAAVLAYGRCFNNGKTSQGKGPRRKVPNDVLSGRPPELIEIHRRVTNEYRGEHVGHRVGPGEQLVFEAVRKAPNSPVVGLNSLSVRMTRPDDHADLRRVAEDLLGRLRPVFHRERDALIHSLNE